MPNPNKWRPSVGDKVTVIGRMKADGQHPATFQAVIARELPPFGGGVGGKNWFELEPNPFLTEVHLYNLEPYLDDERVGAPRVIKVDEILTRVERQPVKVTQLNNKGEIRDWVAQGLPKDIVVTWEFVERRVLDEGRVARKA